ncbi:dienelactone hydrolase family protein [Virgisporangium aurantiacum]|uniref:Carboxymethylenebutenolidase n=1 Tax=Virgisporangium aurantiacum TaxID=175570 RepID=A0A8J3Z4Z7_9ACTN|nr:dienelactone hydrolase family protein [Virgisporangium aurantiacum]GIJ55341.1 carboxymethylenebutenolidase [Virgisporangium aurantiacum]
MKDAIQAGTITVASRPGTEIEAYLARPLDTPKGGVVVIHHAPGFDQGTKEITRRFATWGYAALMPNLNHRIAPGADPDDAAAAARARGGKADDELLDDVGGAVAHLRNEGVAKVGTIGYCSGGRQSVLAATELDVDAAVDCYGAFVFLDAPAEFPLKMVSLRDRLPNLRAPLLGLFGNDDKYPAPAEVDELDKLLTELGKEHEFHRYDGAGHAFFSVDRPAYRIEAALDGYQRIRAFFDRNLGA